MREFVSVKLRCPLCGMEFVADEVHGADPASRETDFRPVYEGPDPIATHMHACPRCRYAAYRAGFETEPSDEDELVVPADDDPRSLPRPLASLPDDVDAEDLRRYARSGELAQGIVARGSEPFASARYALAARAFEFVRDEPLVAAHYHLRAAWCARAEGAREAELGALREVLLRLSPLLESGQGLVDADKVRVRYLAGEAARRSGDFTRAIDFFSQVEKEADADEPEGSAYVYLARRQGQLATMRVSIVGPLPPEAEGRRRPGEEDLEDLPSDDEGGNTLN